MEKQEELLWFKGMKEDQRMHAEVTEYMEDRANEDL